MSQTPQNPRANRWQYPLDDKAFDRLFTAAKQHGPQIVFDADGVFTVSYAKKAHEGSAREFLTNGGPDDD